MEITKTLGKRHKDDVDDAADMGEQSFPQFSLNAMSYIKSEPHPLRGVTYITSDYSGIRKNRQCIQSSHVSFTVNKRRLLERFEQFTLEEVPKQIPVPEIDMKENEQQVNTTVTRREKLYLIPQINIANVKKKMVQSFIKFYLSHILKENDELARNHLKILYKQYNSLDECMKVNAREVLDAVESMDLDDDDMGEVMKLLQT